MIQDALLLLLTNALLKNKTAVFASRNLKVQKTKGGLKYYKLSNELILIEQNPLTKSGFAKRVRSGSKIVWLINTRTNKYLRRIDNGKVFKV